MSLNKCVTLLLFLFAFVSAQTVIYQYTKEQKASYASFAAYLTATGTTKVSLEIGKDIPILATTHIQSTIDLRAITTFAMFTGTYTLYIGKMSAKPEAQVFDTTLTVYFDSGAVSEVYSHWFGNSKAAFKRANNAAALNGFSLVVSKYQYKIVGKITMSSSVDLLRFVDGGILKGNTGSATDTLIIAKMTAKPAYQVFDTSLTVKFTGSATTYIDRKWFGSAARYSAAKDSIKIKISGDSVSTGKIAVGTDSFPQLVNILDSTSITKGIMFRNPSLWSGSYGNTSWLMRNVGYGKETMCGTFGLGLSDSVYPAFSIWPNYDIVVSGNFGIGMDKWYHPLTKFHIKTSNYSMATLENTGYSSPAMLNLSCNRNTKNTVLGELRGSWNLEGVSSIYFVSGVDSVNKNSGFMQFNTRDSGAFEKTRMVIDSNVKVKTVLKVSRGAVLNDSSKNSDTRINGLYDDSLFFALASTSAIGIHTTKPSSLLFVNGSFATAIRVATDTTTATFYDRTIVLKGTAIRVRLPQASACKGREYVLISELVDVKDTIVCGPGDSLRFSGLSYNKYTDDKYYNAHTVQSDGDHRWYMTNSTTGIGGE
jgi:hypothetical protein